MGSNLDLVRTYLDALERGDDVASRALLDPEIVLDMSDIPERGAYEGFAGIDRFNRSWEEAWPTYHLEVQHLTEAPDDRVLALVEEHGRSKSGIELHGQQLALLYTLHAGRIVRIYEYPTWEAALSALDLPEPTA